MHKVGAEPAGALLLVHSVSRGGIDGRGALVRPHVVRHELEEALGVEVGGNRRDLVPILWGGGHGVLGLFWDRGLVGDLCRVLCRVPDLDHSFELRFRGLATIGARVRR